MPPPQWARAEADRLWARLARLDQALHSVYCLAEGCGDRALDQVVETGPPSCAKPGPGNAAGPARPVTARPSGGIGR